MKNVYFFDWRKQTKLQWLDNRKQSSVKNLNNAGREVSGHWGTREEYLKAEIDELKTNSKIKTLEIFRGISGFKKGNQPRTKIVKDEKSDFVKTTTVFLLPGTLWATPGL
jgi:phage host-nuclease inhibitor protein Gam